MKKLLRIFLAGWGAKNISERNGCGCIGTIIIFLILFAVLGYVMDWL